MMTSVNSAASGRIDEMVSSKRRRGEKEEGLTERSKTLKGRSLK
jgi:hypothetical protein